MRSPWHGSPAKARAHWLSVLRADWQTAEEFGDSPGSVKSSVTLRALVAEGVVERSREVRTKRNGIRATVSVWRLAPRPKVDSDLCHDCKVCGGQGCD